MQPHDDQQQQEQQQQQVSPTATATSTGAADSTSMQAQHWYLAAAGPPAGGGEENEIRGPMAWEEVCQVVHKTTTATMAVTKAGAGEGEGEGEGEELGEAALSSSFLVWHPCFYEWKSFREAMDTHTHEESDHTSNPPTGNEKGEIEKEGEEDGQEKNEEMSITSDAYSFTTDDDSRLTDSSSISDQRDGLDQQEEEAISIHKNTTTTTTTSDPPPSFPSNNGEMQEALDLVSSSVASIVRQSHSTPFKRACLQALDVASLHRVKANIHLRLEALAGE